MHIAMLLEMAAEGDPERTVLGSHDGGISAAELLERSRRAAVYFEKSGAGVVGYFGLNSDALPVALFGAALAGVPFAPINYRAPDEQLAGILGRIEGGLMIADGNEVERLRACGAEQILTKDEFASAIAQPVTGEHPFVDPEEIAVLLFTSGTTAEPKAAVLRHRHLGSYIISSVEFMGSRADGGTADLRAAVPHRRHRGRAELASMRGRRIVYLPTFDAEAWVRLATDERITHAMVVPTMLGRILEAVEDARRRASRPAPSLLRRRADAAAN